MVCPHCTVQDYVTNGLENKLIDPDGGANIEHKHHELATAGGSVVDWISLSPSQRIAEETARCSLSSNLSALHGEITCCYSKNASGICWQ